MRVTLKGIKIRGVRAIVPANVCRFEDELKEFPFPEKSSRRLGRVMGFNEHRISDSQSTGCDLASYGINSLIRDGKLDRDKLEGLIVVSQTPDHLMPGNSKVIHGQLELPDSVFCQDIYEHCTGFMSGLFSACNMIASGAMREVELITTHSGSCRANKLDRNNYPLCGDAAAIVSICAGNQETDSISFVFHNDGTRRDILIVPAGGCRMPYSEETAKVFKDEMGNYRSLNNLYMDGAAVFQFVMESVPSLISEVCKQAGIYKKDLKYIITHQPNRFMLEKLADLMSVPREIMFNNIVENFGNPAASTIPLNMAFNLDNDKLHENPLLCLAAFGAGLSLGAAVCRVGELDFCDIIEHPGDGCINPSPHKIS